MRTRSQSPTDWWAGLPPGERTFMRDIAWMVEIMLEGEVLEVRKKGESFASILRCRSPEEREAELSPPKLRPEGWWAGLNAGERQAFRELARMVLLLRGSAVLEMRRSGSELEVIWVLPAGGKAETN